MNDETHLSDQELLEAADGEVNAVEASRIARHLEQCWSCRARQKELENAVVSFVRAYEEEFDGQVPPPDAPRALLRARMSQLAVTPASPWQLWHNFRWDWKVAALALAVVAFCGALLFRSAMMSRTSDPLPALPQSSLTPGAVVRIERGQLCGAEFPKNKMVPVALQHEVFREYGIRSARLGSYEIDYLITPALGGADDIHNLWPQPYSSQWNAHVKDALEDHLRNMVCRGDIELATAQQEIASDWIAAYRKYFHTEHPTVSE